MASHDSCDSMRKISKSLIDGNQISFPWTLMDSTAAYWPGFHWNLSSIHSRLITGILKSNFDLVSLWVKFLVEVLIPTLYKMRLRIRLWKGPFCEAIINHLENVENNRFQLKLWRRSQTQTSYTNWREHISNLSGNFLKHSILKDTIWPKINKPYHSRWIMKRTNHSILWPRSDRVRLTKNIFRVPAVWNVIKARSSRGAAHRLVTLMLVIDVGDNFEILVTDSLN